MISNKDWQKATLLKRTMAADNVMSLIFSIPEWLPFQPGQHYDIRLTSADGYMAERSYSIGSAPEQIGTMEFGVQLLPDGEVSPYLNALPEGRQVEMRGPIGGHFIWNVDMPGPLVLIAGGSGMVPLMSMLRHHINNLEKNIATGGAGDLGREIIFLISARTFDHILWQKELEEIAKKDPNIKIVITLTDSQPEGWTGYKRRIDKEILTAVLGNVQEKMPMTYICGPTPFVEAISRTMLTLGFTPHSIKTERFGG